MLTKKAIVLAIILGIAAPVAQAQEFACTAYVDRDFRGAGKGLNPGQSSSQTRINDKISSFRIVRGCRVVAYEHAEFRGPSAQWTQSVPYVGDNWNDLISSWRCLCN
jgi:hypothetical protein